MDIVNVECQLAQAQMARYLAGDSLPEDTVVQLEKHVKECDQCQKAAQDKKISLKAMLGEDFEISPAPEESVEAPEDIAAALRAEMGLPPTEIHFEEPKEIIQPRQPAPIPVADDPIEEEVFDEEPPHPAPAIAQEPSELESDPELAAAVAELEQDPVLMAAQEESTPAEPSPTPAASVAEVAPDPDEAPEKSRRKIAFKFSFANLKPYLRANAKPLVMGFALGAVLMGMGAFTRKPTAGLGPRAIEESKAAAPREESPAHTESEPEKSAETAEHHPAEAHEPTQAKPEPTHEEANPPQRAQESEYRAARHEEPEPVHRAEHPEKVEHPKPAAPREQQYKVATASGVQKATLEGGKVKVEPAKPAAERAVAKPRPPSASVRRSKSRRLKSARRAKAKISAPKPGTGFVKVYR